jgi:hypothetical protein
MRTQLRHADGGHHPGPPCQLPGGPLLSQSSWSLVMHARWYRPTPDRDQSMVASVASPAAGGPPEGSLRLDDQLTSMKDGASRTLEQRIWNLPAIGDKGSHALTGTPRPPALNRHAQGMGDVSASSTSVTRSPRSHGQPRAHRHAGARGRTSRSPRQRRSAGASPISRASSKSADDQNAGSHSAPGGRLEGRTCCGPSTYARISFRDFLGRACASRHA